MGLSFSVPNNCKIPPSLINIFKEIEAEFNKPVKKLGDLTYLAKQGVFLLNTILTVVEHKPMSHNIKEYSYFIQDLLGFLDKIDQPMVFMLWGAPAGKKAALIDASKHCILRSAHPSPLSAYRGFFGNNHFNLCNQYLIQHGQQPIQW